jgi:hypothetical protein
MFDILSQLACRYTHQTRAVPLRGAGAMVSFARRIEPPVKVFEPDAVP